MDKWVSKIGGEVNVSDQKSGCFMWTSGAYVELLEGIRQRQKDIDEPQR